MVNNVLTMFLVSVETVSGLMERHGRPLHQRPARADRLGVRLDLLDQQLAHLGVVGLGDDLHLVALIGQATTVLRCELLSDPE